MREVESSAGEDDAWSSAGLSVSGSDGWMGGCMSKQHAFMGKSQWDPVVSTLTTIMLTYYLVSVVLPAVLWYGR